MMDRREKLNALNRRKAKHWNYMMRAARAAQGCSCGKKTGKLVHHHVDPDTKRYNISDLWGHPWETVLAELEKCTVLCWSCHKKVHHAL